MQVVRKPFGGKEYGGSRKRDWYGDYEAGGSMAKRSKPSYR